MSIPTHGHTFHEHRLRMLEENLSDIDHTLTCGNCGRCSWRLETASVSRPNG